jgi:hypothetical protein
MVWRNKNKIIGLKTIQTIYYMNFIILFFSLLASSISPVIKYNFEKIGKDSYSGCDGRYPLEENNIDDQSLITKIGEYIIYKELLKALENENIGILDKLRIIDENNIMMLSKKDSKYTKNLYAGGLMDDFDFDFNL